MTCETNNLNVSLPSEEASNVPTSFGTAFQSFAEAFSGYANRILNDKGGIDCATTSTSRSIIGPVLDAFQKLVLGVEQSSLEQFIKTVLNAVEGHYAQGEVLESYLLLSDLMVMLFHKRNPRGGEKIKKVFQQSILVLYQRYPKMVISLLDLVATFGCWKDHLVLCEMICQMSMTPQERFHQFNPLIEGIAECLRKQVSDDLAEIGIDLEKLCSREKEVSNAEKLKITNLQTKDLKKAQLTLVMKWIGREGKHFDKTAFWYYLDQAGQLQKVNLVTYLAAKILKRNLRSCFAKSGATAEERSAAKKAFNSLMMTYRKSVISPVMKALDIPEVLMCANNWGEIRITKLSARARALYTKALLNEKVKGACPISMDETGNRHPDDPVRVACRKQVREDIATGKIKDIKVGASFFHELMGECSKAVSTTTRDIARAAWYKKIEDTEKDILEMRSKLRAETILNLLQDNGIELTETLTETLKEELVTSGFSTSEDLDKVLKSNGCQVSSELLTKLVKAVIMDLKKDPRAGLNVISMIDVSGSMTWSKVIGSYTPMDIAIAMGCATSQLARGPLKGLLMTFSADPHFFQIPNGTVPEQMKQIIVSQGVGYNTDFWKAQVVQAEMCAKNKISQSDLPTLVVYTDGQFDQMGGSGWKTQHQKVVDLWKSYGYESPPVIVYWNLQANVPGFKTTADTPGVILLQGFSESLLKFVILGERPKEADQAIGPDGKVKQVKPEVTPEETLRAVLDQEIYLPVRVAVHQALEEHSEGPWHGKLPVQAPELPEEKVLKEFDLVDHSSAEDDFEVLDP